MRTLLPMGNIVFRLRSADGRPHSIVLLAEGKEQARHDLRPGKDAVLMALLAVPEYVIRCALHSTEEATIRTYHPR